MLTAAERMMVTVSERDVETVRGMLREEPGTHAWDGAGRTGLSVAAQLGYAKVVELLPNFRAKVKARDRSGWTPLCEAEVPHRITLADLLRQRGAQD